MKNLAFASILFLFSFVPYLKAQNPSPFVTDALRFSQSTFGGSARMQGIAGAGTALGGDVSSAFINPAGLGFLRRSEFSGSLAAGSNGAQSTFLGAETDGRRFNMNLNQLGMVFSQAKSGTGPNKGGSFAIAVNRINDFQNYVIYEGVNNNNSLIDFFLDRANGVLTWDYMEDQGSLGITDVNALAFYNYVINPDFQFDQGRRNTYWSFIPFVPTRQQEEIRTRGSHYEWSFAYGGNYDDKLYYGAGIGIQTLRYQQERTLTELTPASGILNTQVLSDRLDVNGIGANFRAGLIYRPVDFFRIGVSAVTPTVIRMTDNYRAQLFNSFNNYRFIETVIDQSGNEVVITDVTLTDVSSETEPLQSSYSLVTPFRLSAGAAVFAGKRGFISADVEYIGFNHARLRNPDGFSFGGDNADIQALYQNTVNFRLGGELRFSDIYLRGGYALYTNPRKVELTDGLSLENSFITMGFGKRTSSFFADLAVVINTFESRYTPYTLSDGSNPIVFLNNSKIRAMATVGFFF